MNYVTNTDLIKKYSCRICSINYTYRFFTLLLYCYTVSTLLNQVIHLPIFFRIASVALEQSYMLATVLVKWPRKNIDHDDVIKWRHFPRNWAFVRGIHRSPVNSSHKGQWRGSLMFSLICVWTNDWVNNREAGDLRRYRAHYDVIVM